MSLDPEVDRVLSRYDKKPKVVPIVKLSDLTDHALALAFTQQYSTTLRYVHAWRAWMQWDETRWSEENTLRVWDLIRTICLAAALPLDEKDQKALLRYDKVNAIVSMARTDRAHAMETKAFDTHPWLLNTPDCTIDLETGESYPHDRTEYLTKITPLGISTAEPTLWLQCLATWTKDDPALVAFLQRLVGYSLTGSVREHVLPIVHGPGGGGKTTFVETIQAIMGTDYYTLIPMERLVVTKYPQHPTDLADLFGRRLAIATETEEGRTLDEAMIKRLTGGETIKARRMRQDFFEFQATHKLWIVGNYKPGLRYVDEAIRRRVLLVPFEVSLPEDERDGQLREKLVAEYPAILGWAVAGAKAWLASGLQPPERVRAATTAYLGTADAFKRWCDERLVLGNQNATALAKHVFADWKQWATNANEFVGTETRFNDRLEKLPGVDSLDKTRDGKRWIGLDLKPADPTDAWPR